MQGTGTAADPYLITTPNDLKLVTGAAKHFKLMNDLDLTGFAFTYMYIDTGGSFDGNNKKIKNPTSSYRGIFYSNYGLIKNLTIENPTITNNTDSNAGGLCDYNTGTIENCQVIGGQVTLNMTNDYHQAGGLVGTNTNNAVIRRCKTVNVKVNGGNAAGGLVGRQMGKIYESSAHNPTVSPGGSWARAGGLVGAQDQTSALIQDCQVIDGTLATVYYRGGFACQVYAGQLIRCVASITVGTATTDSYAFTAMNQGSTYTDCYVNMEKAGTGTKKTNFGAYDSYVTSLTTAQYKQQASFTKLDFTTPLWRFEADGPLIAAINAMKRFLFQDGATIKKYEAVTNYAYDAGASTSYVSIPNAAKFTNANGITVEGWVNFSSHTIRNAGAEYYAFLFAKWVNPSNGGPMPFSVYLQYENNGMYLKGWVMGSGANEVILNAGLASSVVPINTWHHIALVHDQVAKKVFLYVNGVLKTQGNLTAVVANSTNPITVGGAHYSNTGGHYGLSTAKFDEFRIWNRPKTQSEIQEYMKVSARGDEANLVGCYKFDTPGTTVTDSSPSPINGTGENKYVLSTAIQGSRWTTVGSAPATESMFKTSGMSDISSVDSAAINGLTTTAPEVLYWTDADLNEATMTLLAVPTPKLIFPEGDIAITMGAEDFALTASAIVAGTDIKVIASVNGGVSWKSMPSPGTWVTVDVENLADVKAKGMTPTVFNSLDRAAWQSLIKSSQTIRFAYYLEQERTSASVFADKLDYVTPALATATPSVGDLKITADEITLVGRMQDLEKINAINVAKLNFKSNALIMSTNYELHDMIVDTFETDASVEAGNTTATYDNVNKEYIGASTPSVVMLPAEILPVYRKTMLIVAESQGAVSYEFSLDGGGTWQAALPDSIIDISAMTGLTLKVKAILIDETSTLSGIAISWA